MAKVKRKIYNINTASKEQLLEIDGIGPAKANSIIKFRQSFHFHDIFDLTRIPGFDHETVEKLKDKITV